MLIGDQNQKKCIRISFFFSFWLILFVASQRHPDYYEAFKLVLEGQRLLTKLLCLHRQLNG